MYSLIDSAANKQNKMYYVLYKKILRDNNKNVFACDAEYWINDEENSDLNTGIHFIFIYIHIEKSYLESLHFLDLLQNSLLMQTCMHFKVYHELNSILLFLH